MGNKLQPAVFFLCWSFSIPVWCVILFTYLLRNTRCEITLQVWKHFSVSETGLSTLQTALLRKLSENRQWGGGTEFVFPQLYSSMIPMEVQSSHWTALAILPSVMAEDIELILQTETCSFPKVQFPSLSCHRSLSNYEKGHLQPNHHHWSWMIRVWQKGEIIIW